MTVSQSLSFLLFACTSGLRVVSWRVACRVVSRVTNSYGVRCVRKTMREVHADGLLDPSPTRKNRLLLRLRPRPRLGDNTDTAHDTADDTADDTASTVQVSVTYFRAGYTPDDYLSEGGEVSASDRQTGRQADQIVINHQ